MFTRFRVDTNRPTKRYACHVSPISLLSKSYTHAFNDPHWYRAMLDGYNALIKNKTWILVPRPHNVNIVRCLWLFGIRADIAYLLLYVDDIVLTASSTAFLQRIITSLHAEFSMTYLGPLNYFWVSLSLVILPGCFSLNRSMLLSLAEALQYLTFTRPGISYAVQQAGCLTTRRSTSGYYVFLGNNLLSWSSKRQFTISRSSAEAEYQGVANAVAETCWLRNLLRELYTPLAIFPDDVKCFVHNDVVAAIASGTMGKLHGCVLIAGTGTIAYGYTEDGREAHASGARPVLGDWGSYDMQLPFVGFNYWI
uniref:N-acetyl-D-glucosamine kinase n=1 Tax=Tanacetum cinerariifolium TaxID=118510 RepID=A0A699GWS2_TANCI|nr:ribonuclease H-like domain-containing protein [Tanacetum cinerariifolium]